MDYTEILRKNMDAVGGLDAEKYPSLHHLMNKGTLHAHLLSILAYMDGHPFPREQDSSGRGYWSISIGYLRNKYGGSFSTWQSHIIFLLDAGLLRRILPDKFSRLPEMKAAFKTSRKEKRKSPAFYQPVEFTGDVLEKAERTAARYMAAGVSVSKLTKSDVIGVSGQQRANSLYRDGRIISAAERWARDQVLTVILNEIQHKGYTNPFEILEQVKPMVVDQKQGAAVEKIMQRKPEICREAGCRYKPPTRAEREAFHLDNSKWIIVQKDLQFE